jgi:hypothetical protein
MQRIAFLTMALLKAPRADPAVAGFMSRIEKNFACAEACAGFIDRSRMNPDTGIYDWGCRATPKTFPYPNPGDRLVRTLSIWRDLESVVAYSYSNPHSETLSLRREWCVRPTWPSYVAWWIDGEQNPTWPESNERFDSLVTQGPTAFSFDFRKAFGPDGHPCTIVRP